MRRRWFSPSQVARRSGVCVETVRRHIKSGNLEARRTPGGHFRIDPSVAETFLEPEKNADKH